MRSILDTRSAITQLIFIPNLPQRVDLIIVLGSDSLTSMDPAIDLFKSGMTDKIVITGRGSIRRKKPEWQRFQEYAIEKGVPHSAIAVEREASNTRENFIFSKTLIEYLIGWHNIGKIAVATQPLHTRRALMTALAVLAAHIELSILSPSDESLVQSHNWWHSIAGQRLVLDELRRIGEYGIRGHVADF